MQLLARIAVLAFISSVATGWIHPAGHVIRLVGDMKTAETSGDALDRLAAPHMEVGRFYLRTGHYLAALNRFKLVVTKFPSSPYVEEARIEAR
jgi:Outer membrane lipoprotein